jgi:thiosulfate/3-mercaptopyruvate sulfurtransferase
MYRSLISPERLQAALADPHCVVIDCRYDLADTGAGRRAYLEGHIPGAIYAHLHDDLSGPTGAGGGRHPLPTPARLIEVFSRFGIDGAAQIVAYDDASGSMAARLWWLLRYMGHERVAVLDGGWSAWKGADFATESGPAAGPAPRRFQGEPQRHMLVTVDEVPSAGLLIDSREPPRYRGEIEPLDPIAGHIPGARNRYWKSNLDEHGRFRPSAALRRDLQSVFAGRDPAAVTFYCGSGVTACHNLLAAVHAGLAMPRLYAGSWSEWCADPARPVARGSE